MKCSRLAAARPRGTPMAHERPMQRCLELARVALAQGDVPVGAVIADGDRIVGRRSRVHACAQGSERACRSARHPGRVPDQGVGGPCRPRALQYGGAMRDVRLERVYSSGSCGEPDFRPETSPTGSNRHIATTRYRAERPGLPWQHRVHPGRAACVTPSTASPTSPSSTSYCSG